MKQTLRNNLNNIYNEKLGFILIGLLPFFATLGRSLLYIDLVLIGLYFVILKIKFYKDIKIKLHVVVYALVLYFIITIFINTLNYQLPYSNALTTNFSVFIVTVLFLIIFSSFCFNFKKIIPLLIKVMFYSIALLNIIYILSFMLDINIIISLKSSKLVPYHHSFFHSAQSFYVVPIGIFLYYTLQNKNAINIISLIIILVATILLQGRTAILTIITGLAIFFVFYYWEKTKKIYIILTLSAVGIATLLIISYISSGNLLGIEQIHTSGRINGFSTYISYVNQKNTLLGIGILGDNHMYHSGLMAYKHPHNIFMEAYVTMGFFGLFALSILILSLFTYIVKLAKFSKIEYAKPLLFSTLGSFLISSQAFWSIWSKNHLVLMLLYLLLAILIIDENHDNNHLKDKNDLLF